METPTPEGKQLNWLQRGDVTEPTTCLWRAFLVP